jgi:hypothetical protein
MANVLPSRPAGSPEVNPIENLWAIPKRRVKELGPENQEELINMITTASEGLEISLANKLVDSMPERPKV